jgi:maleate cis-trans isomerase
MHRILSQPARAAAHGADSLSLPLSAFAVGTNAASAAVRSMPITAASAFSIRERRGFPVVVTSAAAVAALSALSIQRLALIGANGLRWVRQHVPKHADAVLIAASRRFSHA